MELQGTAPDRARQAIKALGGPRGVVDFFKRYEMDVEITTVQKWRLRGIPWRYAPWVAEELGVVIDEIRQPRRNGK